MSGYWPNHNLPPMRNQALQSTSNPYNPQADLTTTLAAFGNDINTARAVLAASIPPPTGAFININPPPATPLKTTSKITLPPSLARKRSKKDQSDNGPVALEKSPFGNDSNTSSQGVNTLPSSSQGTGNHRYITDLSGSGTTTVDIHPASAQHHIPTFDILSKTDSKNTQDTPTPVFSTEIGMGKEYPVVKEQPSILLDPINTRNKLFPHGAFRILHDNEYWHKFIVSSYIVCC